MKRICLPVRSSKVMYAASLIIFLIWAVICVVVMIFGSVIVGAILCGAYILIWLCIYIFLPVFVVVKGNIIKEISLFGIVRKKKKLSELKSVKMDNLCEFGGNFEIYTYYYILSFSDKDCNYKYISNYFRDKNTIAFEPTFKSAEMLKKYLHFCAGESEMRFYTLGDLLVNANGNVVCAMTDRADATAEYKRWGNLKNIETVNLKTLNGISGKYYLLNFTDAPKEYETLEEARKDCDVIVLEQTEQTERFLKMYLGDSQMP